MAERYHWTPEQVDELDAEVLAEFGIFFKAQAAHDELQRKKAQRKSGQFGRRGKDGTG